MACKGSRSRRKRPTGLEEGFRVKKLRPKGRLQFFFHCLQSPLPVRDVVGRRKKEPHIEKNAENYCVECYQNNIVGFLKSREKYLFLFTKCAGQAPEVRRFRGQRFVVGYIRKKRWLWRGGHYAVQGPTKIVRFEDAFPLSKFGPRARHWRVKKLGLTETAAVLDHLAGARNIRAECVREIEHLGGRNSVRRRACR